METVLAKNIVSSDVARWQIEQFTWLIEVLCPQYGPLRSAFQAIEGHHLVDMPILQADVLERTSSPLSPQDYISVQLWAQDYMDTLRRRIGMKDWPVQYVARDRQLPMRKNDRKLAYHDVYKSKGRFYADHEGRAVIYFDPSALQVPGYIETHIARRLAELVLLSEPELFRLLQENPEDMIALTAAFLGLGCVSSIVAKPGKNSKDAFSIAIYLFLKGYDSRKTQMVYGSVLPAPLMESVMAAFTQLGNYKSQLDKLRTMIIFADTFKCEQIG